MVQSIHLDHPIAWDLVYKRVVVFWQKTRRVESSTILGKRRMIQHHCHQNQDWYRHGGGSCCFGTAGDHPVDDDGDVDIATDERLHNIHKRWEPYRRRRIKRPLVLP